MIATNLRARSEIETPLADAGCVLDIIDGTRPADEEQFGLVVPVIKCSDPENALARANASPYGLGGSTRSSNVERAHGFAERMG